MIIVLCSRCEKRSIEADSTHVVRDANRIHIIEARFREPDADRRESRMEAFVQAVTYGNECFIFCDECNTEWKRSKDSMQADFQGQIDARWREFLAGGKS